MRGSRAFVRENTIVPDGNGPVLRASQKAYF